MSSDNGSAFKAAAQQLPKLLSFTELSSALRKKSINWIFTPPYSPSQGGSWESMVKLVKSSLLYIKFWIILGADLA